MLRDHLQDHLPALQEFNMVGSWVRVGGWVGKVHLPLGVGMAGWVLMIMRDTWVAW